MSGSALVRDAGDRWELALEGPAVVRCCFDFAVALSMSTPSTTWELRIEQPFLAVAPGGTELFVIPEEAAHVEVVLRLLRATAVEVSAFKEGSFEARFSDGTILQVPPSEGFEAWTLSGPDGIRLVSLPGGDLAVWGTEEQPG